MCDPSLTEPEELFCSDTGTMLFLDGETVYSWKIVEISEADMLGDKKPRGVCDLAEYHDLVDEAGRQYKLHCEYDRMGPHLQIWSWYETPDGVTATYLEYDSLNSTIRPKNLTKAKLRRIMDDMMIREEDLA